MSTSAETGMAAKVGDEKLQEYGWIAVARNQEKTLAPVRRASSQNSQPIKASDIQVPDTALAKKVYAYAKEKLSKETFSHSMRVFYYGRAILKKHFPDWAVSDETYLVTCLLHDIGTTHDNIRATLLSFEFSGGYLALDELTKMGAPRAQAESVAETIIRHQDLGDSGMVSQLTFIIHLATIFDNVGLNDDLISRETIEDVVKAWPRNRWTGCFAKTIREELALKPWSHTSAIDNFAEMVEGNKLMQPYD